MLDPRSALLAVLTFACLVLTSGSPWMLGICIIALLVSTVLAEMSLFDLILRTRKLLWFLIFIIGTNVFTRAGTVTFTMGKLIATKEGFIEGSLLAGRLVAVFWGAQVFVHSIPPARLLQGIQQLFAPFIHRTVSFLIILSIAFNFVPSLVRMAHGLRMAHLSRGVDIESGLVRRLKYLSTVQVPLFRTAFRMSEQLAAAMEARCYNPETPRTSYSNVRFKTADWLLVGACLLLLAVSLLSSG